MLGRDSRLRVNEQECAAKVIDGEAVIMNLVDGTYYSLDRAGGTIWELAADGCTFAEVVEQVTTRYDVDSERAQRDVERLLGELLAERLLVPSNGSPAIASNAATHAPSTRLPYAEPTLTTYRDMADLLALDPPMPRLEDIVWNEPGDAAMDTRSP